jgi:hypothetical protein
LTRIESFAFSYSLLKSIVIPRNVQFIEMFNLSMVLHLLM